MRTRAWRRYKNYTKAKRKRDIDYYDIYWWNYKKTNDSLDFANQDVGWYNNLHQYSKNKIHCSCPMCSAKTRNKGRRRKNRFCAPAINYSMMDLKRQQSMDADEKENNKMKYVRFYGSTGYDETEYEFYEFFDDSVTEVYLDNYSNEIAYDNAKEYEDLARGDGEWRSYDDELWYFENAMSYCSWEYCTEEEFLKNTEGD